MKAEAIPDWEHTCCPDMQSLVKDTGSPFLNHVTKVRICGSHCAPSCPLSQTATGLSAGPGHSSQCSLPDTEGVPSSCHPRLRSFLCCHPPSCSFVTYLSASHPPIRGFPAPLSTWHPTGHRSCKRMETEKV